RWCASPWCTALWSCVPCGLWSVASASSSSCSCVFFFSATAATEIYTLSLHDALPSSAPGTVPAISTAPGSRCRSRPSARRPATRSEEHTSELQSRENLVCRLLLEKKKKKRVNRRVETKEVLGLGDETRVTKQTDRLPR